MPALPLTESARAALQALAEHGPVTRPQLGAMLALSKPTMSAAVAELGTLGLVASRGVSKGALGRTAKVYGLGPAAGYVIGIDIGAAQVRVVAHLLDGGRLAALEKVIPPGAADRPTRVGDVVVGAVRAAVGQVGAKHGPLRAIAAAVPRIVAEHRLGVDPVNGPEVVLHKLRKVSEVPVLLENNVNCAAVGEMHYGIAKGSGTFAYLQVGVRIGLGIVSEGRLFRGFGGAAGEVGRLPFPWSATRAPRREGLEHYLGSEALIERCAAGWPAHDEPPPASAKELFARAESGSAIAQGWVARHAADIGRLVAGCVCVLDPGLVVLGGGVGQNPLVVPEVARVARELTWPTRIEVSALGESATVLGAMKLAAAYGLGQILGDDSHPAVVLPPLSDAPHATPAAGRPSRLTTRSATRA